MQELSRLPGIGPKTAQRLAFHLLRVDRVRAEALEKSKQMASEKMSALTAGMGLPPGLLG